MATLPDSTFLGTGLSSAHLSLVTPCGAGGKGGRIRASQRIVPVTLTGGGTVWAGQGVGAAGGGQILDPGMVEGIRNSGQGRPQMPGLEGGAERRPPDPALWQHPVGVAADRPHSPGPWAPPIHCPGSSRGPDALSIAGGVLLGAGGGAPTESPRSPGPWQPTPVLLPGKSHGRRSSGGLQSMGSLRVGHD